MLIKTTRSRFDALRERIVSLHPYEVPEIVALDIAAGFDPYLEWIVAQTQPMLVSPRRTVSRLSYRQRAQLCDNT